MIKQKDSDKREEQFASPTRGQEEKRPLQQPGQKALISSSLVALSHSVSIEAPSLSVEAPPSSEGLLCLQDEELYLQLVTSSLHTLFLPC